MFKESADIKTADQLNLPTPTPHFETIAVKPSEYQQEMIQALSERAALVHSGSVDPKVDNMLKITSDGRKLGLDQRLINPLLPDDPGSKVNACVQNVFRIWREGQAGKLTQLLFCDLSTPTGKAPAIKDDAVKWMLHLSKPANCLQTTSIMYTTISAGSWSIWAFRARRLLSPRSRHRSQKEGAFQQSTLRRCANFAWQHGKNGRRHELSGSFDCPA